MDLSGMIPIIAKYAIAGLFLAVLLMFVGSALEKGLEKLVRSFLNLFK